LFVSDGEAPTALGTQRAGTLYKEEQQQKRGKTKFEQVAKGMPA
jgi:hypothetical protein